jgi:hypothetical protein
MTIDLTPAPSLSTRAGYGLATSRGTLNSTAHITAGPASHSTGAREQLSDPAGINGGEHCVEIQCTADEPVTTMPSPMGAVR